MATGDQPVALEKLNVGRCYAALPQVAQQSELAAVTVQKLLGKSERLALRDVRSRRYKDLHDPR
jgi:hypothetical protein